MLGVLTAVLVVAALLLTAGAFVVALRAAARRAERTLGRTMQAASAVVSEGLFAVDPQRGLDGMAAQLARLLDADAVVLALPTGDGRIYCGASFGYSDPESQFIGVDEGMCGKAFTTGLPVVAPDVDLEPSYSDTLPDMRSAAAVPMRYEGRVLGVLDVESSHRVYDESDLSVLVPLADQIAAVLESQRLREAADEKTRAERRARHELEAISSVILAGVAAVNDFDVALQSMMVEIGRSVGWESMAVILFAEDGRLHARAAYGYPDHVVKTVFPPGQGIVGTVAESGRGRLSPDVRLDPLYANVVDETRSEMCVPLRVGDRVLGVLNAESPRLNAFSTDDFRLLETLADQMAIVVERARLTNLERMALERLRELDQLKEDFIATVSHELRTPLTSIKGFAQTMIVREGALDDRDRRAFLEVMLRQCDRLAAIVDTLLLVSRLESGEVDSKAAYLLIGELMRDAAEAADGRDRVIVEVPPGAAMLLDQFRVHHVIRNLIENACKYSPPGLPVLARARIEDDELTVEVLDKGTGIPAGSEEAIFDRFRRLGGPGTTKVPGTGLGLYIARRFARDLGGDVWVERASEGEWTGARFVLRAPGVSQMADLLPRARSDPYRKD